jgi:hypothetical protein
MAIVLIIAGVLALFVIYFFIVLRIRAHKEHQRERDEGLDPLR